MWAHASTREALALDYPQFRSALRETEQRRGPAGALLASALVRFG